MTDGAVGNAAGGELADGDVAAGDAADGELADGDVGDGDVADGGDDAPAAVSNATPADLPTEPITASVVGASGFVGGELLRLLAGHPAFEVVQATSRSAAGRSVGSRHPPLRGAGLRFSDPADLESVDVLFAAVPHGVSMGRIDAFRDAADLVVDLSADFRLDDAAAYDTWYDGHDRPDLLGEATYGLVERGREALAGADLVAVGGCNASAAILALAPLVDGGILSRSKGGHGSGDRIVLDCKVGSSEGGAGGGPGSAHPERSGVVRPYAPTGHRHEAEIAAELGLCVSMTVHAVDMVRGAAATVHAFPEGGVDGPAVWSAFRECVADEPFLRLVAGGSGPYRYPEPKAVAGTNHAELGLAIDEAGGRIVAMSAIDNMGKGSAGQAVHAANVALGMPEKSGLTFRGLHPVGAP